MFPSFNKIINIKTFNRWLSEKYYTHGVWVEDSPLQVGIIANRNKQI